MHNYTVSSWFNYLASHLAVPAYGWVLEGFEPLISDLGKGQCSNHWATGPTVLLAETA